ncbi:NAD(P)-dependent oxidoreductase [Streptomyces sp. JV176]|uniref:NAD-dependent epimerase/dehydratase family protein n=1 Tax=Streptomyces sp. JV176 TaxID=858630 RepID=UPI002E78238F|nr:NAD(P)-dependent oxidoreductase [Streptomyces sp. JV176]MEE1799491.1 NAD(P)-dependent oxidoreductase [Streptomyces sp. JV176]
MRCTTVQSRLGSPALRVAVTGGSGKLGRAVTELLTAQGHSVFNFDASPPVEPVLAGHFIRTTLTEYGQVQDALLGMDMRYDGFEAVVHLAAIPGTGYVPDVEVFHHNMTTTFNVFHAARRAGIKNIVFASSETMLGVPFLTDPPYLPADENFPPRPENVYSLVKHLEETLAEQYARLDPELKIVALRLAHVMDEGDYHLFHEADEKDPTSRSWNLWSYLHPQDGAQAVYRALQHDMTGFEIFLIAADDTCSATDNAELLAARFPDVPVKGELGCNQSLESAAKAKRVLGFEPKHTWRSTAQA